MAAPWEKYAQKADPPAPPQGPWTRYQSAPEAAPPEPEPDTLADRYQQQAARSEVGSMSAGQAVDNIGLLGLNGAAFGLGDEILGGWSAMLGAEPTNEGGWSYFNYDKPIGERYEAARDYARSEVRDARRDAPAASMAAELVGSVAGPGRIAARAVESAGSTLGRIGYGALAGGATGAAYGFGEGQGGIENRAQNALASGGIGAFIGGAVPAIGAGIRSGLEGRAARRMVSQAAKGAPTSDELRAVGNSMYRQVDDAGVQIRPESFDRAKGDIRDYLRANTGFDELPGPGSLTPNTGRVMQIMDEAGERMASEPSAALPFRSLDQMRRQAGAAAGNVTNKTDQKAGVAVIQQLDDYVQRLGPDDVAGGDVEALKSAIGKAREVWGRMSRSQLVDDAMERSENYLSGSASGVRNQFKNILQNKKLASQFTTAERAALRQVTHGGALDQLINLAGGGLAQMGSIGGGFALGGPAGALAGAGLAAGQRKLSEAVTMGAAERARAAIASGQLRSPEVMNALAIAGRVPERLTNALGMGAVPVVSSGLTRP